MDAPNPLLWFGWAAFGTYFVWLVWKKFLPEILRAPALPPEPVAPVAAWLFCEDGAALDREAGWFPLRVGGATMLGARPRADSEATAYIFLNAGDLLEDHAQITFDPARGRYCVRALPAAAVHHNNEPLAVSERGGEPSELADGDTLDLGSVTRFRFTYTGPETP
jgi:hypothetical protein